MRSQIPEAADYGSRPNQPKAGYTDSKGFKTFRVSPGTLHGPWTLRSPLQLMPRRTPVIMAVMRGQRSDCHIMRLGDPTPDITKAKKTQTGDT